MYDIVEKTTPRILVIDDNESIHADFRAILEPRPGQSVDLAEERAALFGQETPTAPDILSFDVDYALQGEEGVEKVCRALSENHPYALAFVDIRMPPGMDGIETIKEIWRTCPTMEIVICSAYSDYSWHDMMEKFGQTDKLLILKKPFDNIEVQQLAASLTLKWQLMNRLDEMVKQRTQEIYHWLRQLDCLNRISTLLEPPEIDWEATLPALVALIPSALRSADRAGVRLTVNDQVFCAGNVHVTRWTHQQEIRMGTTTVGTLEVGYSQEQSTLEDTPLPDDEVELICNISRKIGCALDSHQWRTAVQQENQRLQQHLEDAPA